MSTLVLTNLPTDVLRGLRSRSGRSGRSLEAEALAIIADALGREEKGQTTVDDLQRFVDEMYGPSKPKNVVDELIAERRREAGRESGEE